ncbi:MAG TPA: ClbS/DfsB family four-helix bundle protein [Dehalococcoidia bacterium]|nr:ClbS/DfsB family four-helix bundle protein [Dehalococcoidia bacterium]
MATTKAEALAELDDGYEKLRRAIMGLTDAQRNETWLGSWSVREMLAHVNGWHEEMTAALQRLARGERPTPEGVDYGDADAWNARFVEGRQGASVQDEIDRFDRTHHAFRAAADAVPEDRFGEGKTVNRLVENTGARHYREHLEQLEQWIVTGKAQ